MPAKTWGTVDPSMPGPFEIVIERNSGPAAGVPDAKWNNEVPHFNLYRPKDLHQGYCHPTITWANGTGDQPPTYEVLIKQPASYGFVVVASLSSQSAQGTKVQPGFDSITTVPVMLAELAGVNHGSWIGSIKDPVMVGTAGWMRFT